MPPKRKSTGGDAEGKARGAGPAAGAGNVRVQLVGPRIPYQFFTTTGFGQTDSGGGIDPWETGSYDMALEDAGIQDFNTLLYTSVLPPESVEVAFDAARPAFHHGAVLETIMAEMNGAQGDRISAGVGRAKIRRRHDGRWVGGYAAEYKGHATPEKVKHILYEDLQGIFRRRFDEAQYEMVDPQYCIRSGEVEKGYGTVIAAICFFSYIHPVLDIPEGLESEIEAHEAAVAEGAKEDGDPGTRRRRFF